MKTNVLIETNHGFSTTDFYLSGALLAKGLRFLGIHWDGHRATFSFEKQASLEAEKFFQGTLMVSALAFSNSLRNLKAYLRQK